MYEQPTKLSNRVYDNVTLNYDANRAQSTSNHRSYSRISFYSTSTRKHSKRKKNRYGTRKERDFFVFLFPFTNLEESE